MELQKLDLLDMKLTHLNAMLHMTYGGGAESFNQLSDETRDNFLWACSQTVKESLEIVRSITG